MYCRNCGAQLDVRGRFCPTCGHKSDTAVREINSSHDDHIFDASDTGYNGSVDERDELKAEKYHPWRRFFARLVEFYTFGLVPIFFVSMVLVPQNVGGFNDLVRNPVIAALIAVLIWLPLEAFFISATGTTPIKWLFGIRVLSKDGNALPFMKAFFRSIYVLGPGQGFYIPLINIIAYAFSYNELHKKGRTSWDSLAGASIMHRKMSFIRAAFCTASVVIALFVATGLSSVYGQLSSIDKTEAASSTKPLYESLESQYSTGINRSPGEIVATVKDEPDLYQRLGIAPKDLSAGEKAAIIEAHFNDLKKEHGDKLIYNNEREFYDFYFMIIEERRKSLPRDIGEGLMETKIVFRPASKMTLLEMSMPVALVNAPSLKDEISDEISSEIIRNSICTSGQLNSLFVAVFDGKIHINIRDINGEIIYSDDVYQQHCQRILNGKPSGI